AAGRVELRRALFRGAASHWLGGVAALLQAQAGLGGLRDPRSHRTALELARALLDHEMVRVMEACGATQASNPDFQEWATVVAAARGDKRAVALWAPAARPDWREPPPGVRWTALMAAAAQGHAGISRSLLEGRACAARRDAQGRTPGDLARGGGHALLASTLDKLAAAHVEGRVAGGEARAAVEASLMPEEWRAGPGWEVEEPEVEEEAAESEPSDEGPPPAGAPEPVWGASGAYPRRLIARVIAGHALRPGGILHTLDAYVRVRLSYMPLSGCKFTQTVPNNSNPLFDHEFEFQVRSRTDWLYCAVFDSGSFSDDLLGRCDLKLSKFELRLLHGEEVIVRKVLRKQTVGLNNQELTVGIRYPAPDENVRRCDNEVAPHVTCSYPSGSPGARGVPDDGAAEAAQPTPSLHRPLLGFL
ncbi:unnamed protein product, partial [Prorocentrum cordatum]